MPDRSSPTADRPGPPPAGRLRAGSTAGRWVITSTVLGSAMAAIDATVIGIALPAIGRDLHAPIGTLQWVVTGYTLTLASLLLLGGSLGDRFGRRRVFLIGVVWFALASVACALSEGSTELVVTRMLQGVGGALLTPGSLAILEASFTVDDRSEAIGAWSGLGGVATAAGPLVGGVLLAVASWRWIFVINVPLGALVLWVSARHIPESRDPDRTGGVDIPGAALAALALGGVSYALIEAPARGWASSTVLGSLVLGSLSGVGFALVERRVSSPMLPLGLFAGRQFAVTNAVTLVVYAGLGGVLFLLPTVLQIADHYSALASGMALLPITVVMLALSARSGRLAAVIGPRLQMSVGPIVVGGGLALLVLVPHGSSYPTGVLPGVVVLALGLAVTVAPLTATALNSVSEYRAGVASAVNNDVARIGSLIAVAVLPALGGITGDAYLDPSVLAHGFQRAVLIASAWCVVGGLVAAVGIRNPPRPLVLDDPSSPVGPDHHCALEATPLRGTAPTGPPDRRTGRTVGG